MTNYPLKVTPTPPAWEGSPPHRADERGPERTEPRAFGGLLPKLLYERYGILENPFGVTPNPRYLYQSKTHAEATSSLIIGIECGIGFQALIAPPGMGKTTILSHVLERFKDVHRTAILFQIHGDSHDFLRCLLSELGSEPPDSSVVGLQEAINQLLVREFRSGRRTILVIDEAQSLDTPVLETIRLLSNFETRSEKLVQIILAGQPLLAHKLANSELAQLHQRISILTTLMPFGLEETRNYIEHRLKIAGYQGPLFNSAALRLIWERSGGVPREINTLCFNALLLARAVEQKQIDPNILYEVVADLDLDRLRFNTVTPSSWGSVQAGNGLWLGKAAEDPRAISIDKIGKAAVSGPKAEAEEASARPMFLGQFDLAQFGTRAEEVVPTSSGKDVNKAPVQGTEAGADDASTRPTAFDGVDLAQLGTLAAEISTSSGKKVGQAVIPDAEGDSDDTVGGGPVPDRPSLVTHRKTEVVKLAGARGGGLPSCETKAVGSSMHAPYVTPEALAVEAERMQGAKQNLSPEVASELTSNVRCDFFTRNKPDPRVEIELESGSSVESTPEVEPAATAEAQLRIILAEAEPKCEPVQISLGTSAQRASRWLKKRWQTQRATIYLGTSMLVFLLVLAGWARLPQSSPEPSVTMIFEEFLLRLGLVEPPPMTVRHDIPNTRVWVDVHTGIYYCPGASLYSKTPGGILTTQGQAQLEHFEAADHKLCQ